jgi:hypothetical protein
VEEHPDFIHVDVSNEWTAASLNIQAWSRGPQFLVNNKRNRVEEKFSIWEMILNVPQRQAHELWS